MPALRGCMPALARLVFGTSTRLISLALLLLFLSAALLSFLRRRRLAAKALRSLGFSVLHWRPSASFLSPPYAASRRNLLEAQRRRCAEHAYGVVLGAQALLHVASPSLARAALCGEDGRPASSQKAPFYDAFTAFVGASLFASEGEHWRAQRSAVVRALTASGTAGAARQASAEARQLVASLHARASSSDAAGVCLDLQPRLQRLTLRCTFHHLTGCTLLSAAGSAAAQAQLETRYLAAAATLRASLPAKARSAAFLLLPSLFYRLTPLGRAEAAAAAAAHRMARLSLLSATPASPLRQALNLLCSSAAAEQLHTAATLLFAGHDTQAATLSWATLRLAATPTLQAALRAEARAGRAASEAPLTDAVLRETLRLHPPAPLVVRVLPRGPAGGGARLPPAPAAAAVWLHAVQRNSAAWGCDSDEFRPSRWLCSGDGEPVGEDQLLAALSSGGLRLREMSAEQREAYMPFAAGPRACPGEKLAMAGLRAALAELAAGLVWTADGAGDGLHPSTGFTVTPAGGVRVRVTTVRPDECWPSSAE